MRFIHCADLHLDSKMETHMSTQQANERKKELLLSFKAMTDFAADNEVDAIIIAGDMFDKPKISMKTKDYVLGVILDHPNIDFLYLSGNHDEDSFIESLEDIPSNLKFFTDKWTTFSYGNVDITGITYNLDTEKYMYNTLNLNPEHLNIVTLHGEVSEYKKDGCIELRLLSDKNIDYLALGHIHSYSEGELGNGIYVYSGCLEGRGFDEIGPKGYVFIETRDKMLKHAFVDAAKRTLFEASIDITNCHTSRDIKSLINEKLDGIKTSDMVKVILTGTYSLDLIKNLDLIESELNDKYYFAKISDESKLLINPSDFENDISLKGEFIRTVMASDLSEDDKMNVIKTGIEALTEVA